MIGHVAGGMGATHPGTGIPTLVVHAGLCVGTLRVDGALGLALDVGVARVVSDAGAGGGLCAHCALCVDAARRGVARLHKLNGWGCGWTEGKVGGQIYYAKALFFKGLSS